MRKQIILMEINKPDKLHHSHLPLVTFVIAGAQKSGTNALRSFLAQHPDITFPINPILEPHFFDKQIEACNAGDYTKYHALYPPKPQAVITGDVTPYYIYGADVLPRIRTYNPGMKIIVVLRDPTARAYSQWVMEHEKGNDPRSFLHALLHELYWFCRHGQHPVYSYVQRGFYARQMDRLFKNFPPEQCLILRNEDLLHDHKNTMIRVLEFLGLRCDQIAQAKTVHSRNYKPVSQPASFVLRLIFRRDIRRLENMLGWNCKAWK